MFRAEKPREAAESCNSLCVGKEKKEKEKKRGKVLCVCVCVCVRESARSLLDASAGGWVGGWLPACLPNPKLELERER